MENMVYLKKCDWLSILFTSYSLREFHVSLKTGKTHNITVSHNINNNSWIEMEVGKISLKPHKTPYCFKTKP